MSAALPTPLPQIETIGELRALYRAAEARAARMRMLSISGRALAAAEAATITDVLRDCAVRIAHFLGQHGAQIVLGSTPSESGIAIAAPGPGDRIVAHLIVADLSRLDAVADLEDRDAVRLHLELLGAAIDRIGRERERARLAEALRDREQRLEQFVGQLFRAQEDERRRVSHELHDGVAQTATALARMIESADQNAGGVATRAALAAVARGLVAELRAVIGGLRPTLLDDLGLAESLRAIADTLRADQFDVRVAITAPEHRWPPDVETALFRVAQEAVNNIRKHAGGPCRVAIALHTDVAARCCKLRVRDHGQGCWPRVIRYGNQTDGASIGIDIMRERMIAIGGVLDWQTHPEGGVTVTARLKLP